MSFLSDFLGGLIDFATEGFESLGREINRGLDNVSKTLGQIIDDPVPTLLQIGAYFTPIPPYVVSAAITAYRGGDMSDIAKSAAISYVSAEFMNSELGTELRNYTSNLAAGDFTDWAIENFDIPVDTAVQVAKVSTDALNSTIVGGIRAAIVGEDIAQSMKEGFLSGAILSGTDSYFDAINKRENWGLSNNTLNILKGASSTALTAIATDQDPAAAVGNYIAYATMKLGESSLKNSLKQAYDDFTGKTAEAQKAQDTVVSLRAEYDTQLKAWESDRNALQSDADAYQKRIDNEFKPLQNQITPLQRDANWYKYLVDENTKQFNGNKTLYDTAVRAYNSRQTDQEATSMMAKQLGFNYIDEYGAPVNYQGYGMTQRDLYDAATRYADDLNWHAGLVDTYGTKFNTVATQLNAKVEQANSLASELNAAKASLDARSADLSRRKADLETPSGNNLLQRLQTASADFNKKYADYSASKAGAERAAKSYDMIVAEAAVRDAVIDATNSGLLKVESVDKDGNYVFNNGMTVTKEGKFFQDGQPMFVNAAGLPQNRLQFTDTSGNEVRFDINAGRVLSTTDVQNIFKRDFGLDVAPDVAKNFANQDYTKIDQSRFQNFVIDAIDDEFKSITGRNPTPAETKLIAAPGGNAIVMAKEYAVNALDMPPGTYEDTEKKVDFAKAFSQARAEKGPGQTFTFEGKEYSTNTQNDIVTQKVTQNIDETKDNTAAAIVKQKMMSRIDDRMFNPSDLSSKEISSFVDAYVKATPEQRVAMLRSSDAPMFEVIETLLKQAAVPTGEPIKDEGFGGIKPSDMTNYQQVVKAGVKGAVADVAGLLTRGGQVMGELLGIDTPTLDRAQELFTKEKNTQMGKLVGDERAVAAGLASGITSAVTWGLGGAAGALATMGGIAANNSWIEGAEKGLSPEDNAKRTAMMTAIEIVGEAAGIPGMKALMKGIPVTSNVDEIINGIRRFGAGMLNEQASELLTTSVQMAADKMASFGLAKDATWEDYLNALRDTAISTAVAVGTAGSGASALRALRDASQSPSIFSADTREAISPDVPLTTQTLTKALEDSGVPSDVINRINQVDVKTGDVAGQRDMVLKELQDAGVPTIRAVNIANQYFDRSSNEYVQDFLMRNNFSLEDINTLTPLIRAEIDTAPNPDALAQGINKVLNTSVLDINNAYQVVKKEFPTSPITEQEIRIDDVVKNATPTIEAGNLTQDQVKNLVTEIAQNNPTLTATQIATAVNQGVANAGVNPSIQQVQQAVTNTVNQANLQQTVKTEVGGAETRLSAAIEEAKAAGMQGDQALQSAIDKVSGDLGIAKTDLLTQLGATEAQLRTDFAQQLGGVQEQIGGVQKQVGDVASQLTGAIAEARAAGLQGDQALQAAIDKVSGDLGVARSDLLGQLGKTEQQLRTDLSAQIGEVQQQVGEQIAGVGSQVESLAAQTQQQYENMTAAQKAEVDARVQMGQSLEAAIGTVQQNLTQTAQNIQESITSLSQITQAQYDELTDAQKAEVAARVKQGETLEGAIGTVRSELATASAKTAEELAAIQKKMDDEKAAREAAARAAAAKSASEKLMQQSQQLIARPSADAAVTQPETPPITPLTTGPAEKKKFEGPLAEFFQKVQETSYTQPPSQTMQPVQQVPQQPQQAQQAPQSNYFSYGIANEIDSILNPMKSLGMSFTAAQGGLATPLMAGGGALDVVHYAGKQRMDFRKGAAVSGPGDGQSDDIPAMLADGEFVFPADVVAALGNGSTKAGSDKLYDMMHAIRAHHRNAKPEDLPPPAKKSPLDYLKGRR